MMNSESSQPLVEDRGDLTPGRNGPGNLSDRVRALRLPEQRTRGSGGKLPWILCLIFVATTIGFAFQSFRLSSQEDSSSKPAPAPEVEDKRAGSGDVVLQSKGYIIPAHQIQVSPQVGGRIESLHITEGQRVHKGEILAQLEVVDYDTDYKRALAKFESAKQNWMLVKATYPMEVRKAEHDLEEAQADLQDAVTREDLMQRVRTGAGSVSQEEIQKVQSMSKMAKARLDQRSRMLEMAKTNASRIDVAAAEMEAAKAELEKAVWRLENCTVYAPVSGTILTKKAEEGNLVNPVAFNVSASLCDVADLSDLEVDLTIQERDIANVVVGQKCTVMPEAFQNNKVFLGKHEQGYEGEVSRLMPIADRAKGAIPVRVKVRVPREEEGVYLKPDMGVIVSFKKLGNPEEDKAKEDKAKQTDLRSR